MRYDSLIREMMTATGLKQHGIARKLRVSQPTISRWLKGQQPDLDQHNRVVGEAKKLGLIPDDFAGAAPLPHKHAVIPARVTQRSDALDSEELSRQPDIESAASVPEFDVRGGASYAGGISEIEADTDTAGNSISRDVVRAHWGIPTPFLRDELRLNPGRVHILAVRGDSMNDALFDGDRAIIDLDDTDVSQGGIFAIRDDNGSVIIKQVELLRDRKSNEPRIRCKSRNPQYEPFELILTDAVAVIGRVACKITRL